jgi:hypothetical protein
MEFLLSQAEKENDCGAEYGMRRLIPEFIVCLQAISLLRPAPKATPKSTLNPEMWARVQKSA